MLVDEGTTDFPNLQDFFAQFGYFFYVFFMK